jgi:hypothetical protein
VKATRAPVKPAITIMETTRSDGALRRLGGVDEPQLDLTCALVGRGRDGRALELTRRTGQLLREDGRQALGVAGRPARAVIVSTRVTSSAVARTSERSWSTELDRRRRRRAASSTGRDVASSA